MARTGSAPLSEVIPPEHAGGGSTHAYPRPQLGRAGWHPLNGRWQFALDPDARWTAPTQVSWDRDILVPFAHETAASGVGETGFYRAWVNGAACCGHDGGYTPFSVDVTDLLRGGDEEVIVRATYPAPSGSGDAHPGG